MYKYIGRARARLGALKKTIRIRRTVKESGDLLHVFIPFHLHSDWSYTMNMEEAHSSEILITFKTV